MNIILLEDRGSTAYNVMRWLDENGHHVLIAYNINDAQSHWARRHQVPVHCILLDLQVPMDGLTDEQKADAEGGLLAGWIWLRDTVLVDTPEMKQRIIIYSDYIPILKEKIPQEQYVNITITPKRLRGSSADIVITRIREMSKILEGK